MIITIDLKIAKNYYSNILKAAEKIGKFIET